jgi:hypothetical protein
MEYEQAKELANEINNKVNMFGFAFAKPVLRIKGNGKEDEWVVEVS